MIKIKKKRKEKRKKKKDNYLAFTQQCMINNSFFKTHQNKE